MDLSKRKDKTAVVRITALANERGVAVRRVGKDTMNTLAEQRPHQGVILDCGELTVTQLKALDDPGPAVAETGRMPVWLALDQVADPVRCRPCTLCASALAAQVLARSCGQRRQVLR